MKAKDWEELEKYGKMCADSYGEAVLNVVYLHSCADYISDELKKALEKESKWNLNNFRENATITKRKVINTDEWEELDWNI